VRFVFQRHVVGIFHANQSFEHSGNVDDPFADLDGAAFRLGRAYILHVKIVKPAGAFLDGGNRILTYAHRVAHIHAETHPLVAVLDCPNYVHR
jgi:hypothetical protein